jgi:hypothetical protein
MHQALSQPDGDPRPHDPNRYPVALDDLALMLIKARAARDGIAEPCREHLLPVSWERFRSLAGMLVALSDDATRRDAMRHAIWTVAEGYAGDDAVSREAMIGRAAVDAFEHWLMDAGRKEAR